MTKLVSSDWDAPERRIGRTTKAFQLAWSAFCWTLACAAVTVASTTFLRWHHLM
jgi:hypothetical protein